MREKNGYILQIFTDHTANKVHTNSYRNFLDILKAQDEMMLLMGYKRSGYLRTSNVSEPVITSVRYYKEKKNGRSETI